MPLFDVVVHHLQSRHEHLAIRAVDEEDAEVRAMEAVRAREDTAYVINAYTYPKPHERR